jgi:hypothetical protein
MPDDAPSNAGAWSKRRLKSTTATPAEVTSEQAVSTEQTNICGLYRSVMSCETYKRDNRIAALFVYFIVVIKKKFAPRAVPSVHSSDSEALS